MKVEKIVVQTMEYTYTIDGRIAKVITTTKTVEEEK